MSNLDPGLSLFGCCAVVSIWLVKSNKAKSKMQNSRSESINVENSSNDNAEHKISSSSVKVVDEKDLTASISSGLLSIAKYYIFHTALEIVRPYHFYVFPYYLVNQSTVQ